MKTGDIVKPHPKLEANLAETVGCGIILDAYEDDYGTVYYEVHFSHETGWWSEHELELISES